jgi:hypothetical protein
MLAHAWSKAADFLLCAERKSEGLDVLQWRTRGMEFTLYYRGDLKANCGAKEKHRIRKLFHPQLKLLWKQPPLDRVRDLLNPYPPRCLAERWDRKEAATVVTHTQPHTWGNAL